METPLNSNAAIGARIRARRTQLGLKQADVAKELGMTMQAVSLWENGKVAPGGNIIVTLATVLGCEVSWLLEGVTRDEKEMENLYNHDVEIKKGKLKRVADSIQNKTIASFVPEKFKDDIDYLDDLNNLLMLYCDLNTPRRAEVLMYTIDKWKENTADEIARVDDLYRNIKEDF